MRIQVLTSLAGQDKDGAFTYGKGGIFDVPNDRAKELISSGLAQAVKQAKKETRESKKPVSKRSKD